MARTFDINIDCGESFGNWQMGADEALMPHVTTANMACGFHAGDPSTMVQTVRLAKQYGVAVGAHPGLADLQGFGRFISIFPMTMRAGLFSSAPMKAPISPTPKCASPAFSSAVKC